MGSVVARDLAQRGYKIAIHYRTSGADALEIRDEILAAGVDSAAFQADVGKEDEVERLIGEVHDHFGRIDVLVTTASIWSRQSLFETTQADLISNFNVNTLGTFFTVRAAGKIMASQPEGGAIVTIGDWAIERPYPDHAAYLISKGTIPTLTRTLALELSRLNPKVRVNCIHPGPVMFPPNASEEERRMLVNSTLVKDGNCPDMVAHAVNFLIENRFITGACIPVDGGRHMYSPADEERNQ